MDYVNGLMGRASLLFRIIMAAVMVARFINC